MSSLQSGKEMDEQMKLILKATGNSVFRDLRIKNNRISSFDDFWLVAEEIEKNIEVTQAKLGFMGKNITSFSWFKFYTGRLKIRYMVQQRSTSKAHHDDSVSVRKM